MLPTTSDWINCCLFSSSGVPGSHVEECVCSTGLNPLTTPSTTFTSLSLWICSFKLMMFFLHCWFVYSCVSVTCHPVVRPLSTLGLTLGVYVFQRTPCVITINLPPEWTLSRLSWRPGGFLPILNCIYRKVHLPFLRTKTKRIPNPIHHDDVSYMTVAVLFSAALFVVLILRYFGFSAWMNYGG